MSNTVMMFPSLTDELLKKIRFQKQKYSFFYTDEDGKEHVLIDEPVEAYSSVYCIKDDDGIWTPDGYNLGFKRRYCLRTFQCLFGEAGIACRDAKLGLAIVWTSSESRQRGVISAGTFAMEDKILDIEVEKIFERGELRGEVDFTTVLYLAQNGHPSENEKHFANTSGYILGELEKYTIKLDGNNSVFPVFEVSEPGQPLWYVKCEWIDPTEDSFADCVSVNLNTAHRNYKYIDRARKTFMASFLAEIMASAIGIIIEKVRSQTGYWDQIMDNDDLVEGSVGQAIFYFADTLEWDLSSPESVSLCARKFFDQRI